MGIYDREYYRNEGHGFGRFGGPNQACTWLIIANVVTYFVQLGTHTPNPLDPDSIASPFTNALDLNVGRVLHGEVWRLLTYSFLHSMSIMHIVMNMLMLFFFGRRVEEDYGTKEFLGFYLVSAVVGGLAYTGIESLRGGQASAIGASGAVTAVMVLFAMHYPRLTVYLFGVLPMPVYLLVTIFVVGDAIGLLSHSQSGVAFAVHLGGALFGFLYYRFHWRVLNWWPTRMSMRPRRLRPRLRVFREPNDEDTALADSADPEDRFEAQVDEVLTKVARYGQASLSDREHQILLKASEVYKQRRK